MKILITGHNGFIGKNLKSRLEKTNHVLGYEWADSQRPDITGLDWVIHLGAVSSTAEKDVDKVMLQNYEFSKWLFSECCVHNVNCNMHLVQAFMDCPTTSKKILPNNQ